MSDFNSLIDYLVVPAGFVVLLIAAAALCMRFVMAALLED